MLFYIYFAAIIKAIKSKLHGLDVNMKYNFFHTDCLDNTFFHKKTHWFNYPIMEFLFADDCEIISHSVDDLQKIMTIFHEVSNKFGQQISVKKTEILVVQPRKAYFFGKT